MGYLAVTRREGEKIRLSIDPGVDTERLLQQLLREGITVHIGEFSGRKVKVAIEAPREVTVLREELLKS